MVVYPYASSHFIQGLVSLLRSKKERSTAAEGLCPARLQARCLDTDCQMAGFVT